jgi:transcription elongation factor Elf1
MFQKTKCECCHKLNGKTLLIVVGQIGNEESDVNGNTKYHVVCSSCGLRQKLKMKQLPKDIQWAI